ncbi:MAG TPA: C39 family peptidase [Bacilli bacterium]|nr:C39 family peptidase [Bacilli bacterium]
MEVGTVQVAHAASSQVPPFWPVVPELTPPPRSHPDKPADPHGRIASTPRPPQAQVQVTPLSQKSELYNGCEVTSLAMMLAQAGKPVSKLQLARQLAKDPTPERRDANGRTVSWGDPNRGFVGDVTGRNRGYGVDHGPLAALAARHLPGRVVDLSGGSFDGVLNSIADGRAVVVWTTTSFAPRSNWVSWQSPTGTVRATFSEHAVLVVGYDPQSIVLADPLVGQVRRVNRQTFVQSFVQMGKQAITYRK